MILDSERFIRKERPHWEALERQLAQVDRQATTSPEELLELHTLYRRAASGLTRLEAASGDPASIQHLSALVARAYAEIHSRAHTWSWKKIPAWIATAFPVAFRARFRYFALAVWITIAGMLVGSLAIATSKVNREIIYPFPHLLQDPSKRVAEEQKADRADGADKATFAAYLMANNIRVTINAFALGLTYGIGTVVLLFYNGVVLGAVSYDYIADGQLVFLLAWLLPHGVTEIPAIFIGGAAGLLVARALFGFGDRKGMRARFREIGPDLVALVFGAATLLLWAGIVESYLSQHHEPVIPYAVKIAFGLLELVALVAWLSLAGRKKPSTSAP